MIIFPPEISHIEDRVVLSANLSYDHRPLNKPDMAWFSFPQQYAPFISGRADPFAASLLILAMTLDEDLIIEGPVSPLLVKGLHKYQNAMGEWFPKTMHPVHIEAKNQSCLPAQDAGHQSISLFSGGVDSSYTLMTHLPPYTEQDSAQVKGALFVHGLDIPLRNGKSFQESCAYFEAGLSPQGIEVIPCATNIRYLTSGLIHWGHAHGSAIIGTGLVLDKRTATLLIPSTSIDLHIPWGSSPLIDHFLSTETVTVSHDGASTSRIEKIDAIAHWKPAQKFLRVCVDEDKRESIHNCCRCEKCIRTMVMLEISGTLQNFETFQQPFGRQHVLKWTPQYEHGDFWMPGILSFVKASQKSEYVFPLWIADTKGKIRHLIRKLTPRPVFNWLKRIVYPYQEDIFNPDFIDRSWYQEH